MQGFFAIQAAAAADVAIDACIALQRRSVLWTEVYGRFVAGGCQVLLLERLLPCILANQLTTLGPELMQARSPRPSSPFFIFKPREHIKSLQSDRARSKHLYCIRYTLMLHPLPPAGVLQPDLPK